MNLPEGTGGPFAVNPPLSNIGPRNSNYHRGTKGPSEDRIRDGWTKLHEYSKKVTVGLHVAIPITRRLDMNNLVIDLGSRGGDLMTLSS